VQVRSLLPTHLARAQHLEHDECRSVFASGVFFRLKRARGTSHYVKRKRRRSGKHTKVVAVRMPAKEMRFAAQVHEGDDRAERRGLGARMDASDAQVCRRFLNLASTSDAFDPPNKIRIRPQGSACKTGFPKEQGPAALFITCLLGPSISRNPI
jgi:hypothetical protein